MRTLAIDWGEKRIGLAMSDEGGRFATPLEVIDAAIADGAIAKLIQTEAVARLLVGVPLNMDGSIGPGARRVIIWARSLSTLPIIFVDERLSSFDAEQQLNERKRGGERLTRKQKKIRLDALVAANFLQEFLDGKLPAMNLQIE
jgi:putative Holliday junction resolvase